MQDGTLSCVGCGQAYAIDTWRDLARICTLDGDDVHRHVVAWPEGRVVEVRACRTCGQSMARTANVAPRRDPTSASKPSGARSANGRGPGVKKRRFDDATTAGDF
jgi:hypothetical protein